MKYYMYLATNGNECGVTVDIFTSRWLLFSLHVRKFAQTYNKSIPGIMLFWYSIFSVKHEDRIMKWPAAQPVMVTTKSVKRQMKNHSQTKKQRSRTNSLCGWLNWLAWCCSIWAIVVKARATSFQSWCILFFSIFFCKAVVLFIAVLHFFPLAAHRIISQLVVIKKNSYQIQRRK